MSVKPSENAARWSSAEMLSVKRKWYNWWERQERIVVSLLGIYYTKNDFDRLSKKRRPSQAEQKTVPVDNESKVETRPRERERENIPFVIMQIHVLI